MDKKIYAVIGDPVRHSKSPDIYNYLFQKHGINSTYIYAELKKDMVVPFLKEYAPAMNIAGVNVTMPYKEAVASLAEKLDSASSLLSSVNTLDLENGKGYTTDGRGLALSLEYQDFDIKDKRIVVLGAGGAAKSIVYELAGKNPLSLTVLNRTEDKSKNLAELVGRNTQYGSLYNPHKYVRDCDLLINCTSMGMKGKPPMDLKLLDSLCTCAFVYDIIYEPRKTELLKEAEALGHRVSGGLDMLVCQALYAFEIFTGIPPAKEDRQELLKLLK